MGKLIYSMITSLDGYVSDPGGNIVGGTPDDDVDDVQELHEFVDEQFRSVGTYLYGRRMYETMVFWETAHLEPDQPAFIKDYARTWQAANKIVYSTTLGEVQSERTRLERSFEPEAVRQLKAESEADLTVDGPHLAAHAMRAGLVDEYQLIVGPVLAGGGTRFFPDDVRLDLRLLDHRTFSSGVVFLRYGTAG